jgi:hypothetical protein
MAVAYEQIIEDLENLAGRLGHRGANTESERLAAEYIARRMRVYAPDVVQDPFDSIDSWALLFSAYYFEFLIVTLVALFFPWVALVYGLFVFIAYLAEFTGYHFLTRFLPQYASQNVMGRLLADRPKRLVVVTAYYDSPPVSWLSDPRVAPWLRWIHLGLVSCMAVVVTACAVEALGLAGGLSLGLLQSLRWAAVACLATAGALLLVNERASQPSRGAVSNASGVAALLALAERLHAAPLEETEVVLLATGSHAAGLNGIHHFLRYQDLDQELTYFLNLSAVGAGELRYTTGEGMLYVFGTAREWLQAAGAHAGAFEITPMRLTAWPTDMLVPLARGYKCMSVLGIDRRGVPMGLGEADRVDNADAGRVQRAVDFAEAVVRQLEASG